jgi:hypothetical protein
MHASSAIRFLRVEYVLVFRQAFYILPSFCGCFFLGLISRIFVPSGAMK